ncbi:ATP-dependent DNA helicase [Sphingobium arseniciresistens]|uniref:ATP-dependent DNA helicase n=1 Tax=Sphingobium arseniciresistens TaxID=3030834 RepID=UPI0030CA52B2
MVVRRAALFGIRHSEDREAVNNQGQLIRAGLASHLGEVRLSDLRPLIDEQERRAKLLETREQTGDGVLTRGRTTRRTARLEIALANHLALAMKDVSRLASSDKLLAVLEGAGLSPSQEQALATLSVSRDRVIGIHGVAGAGKSTLVKAMVAAVDQDIHVMALAPTSSAAANLGAMANIESRTVASLIATGARTVDHRYVLVVDEAGQLSNRQALRLLEISRDTGARLLLLGDNLQTGAIEQGKAFWLLQRLGLPKAELTESMRQQTRQMKHAVALARLGDYAGSIDNLDKVVSANSADVLARELVAEWTRLKPETRETTNILVLDNATRRLVNEQIREALKREGVLAAQDTHFQVLSPAPTSLEERRMARFYAGGQVVMFNRSDARLGILSQSEYRVLGLGRESNGRQIVRLVDEQGLVVRWDPRLTRPSQINVFNAEDRALAVGDRIQWRLATKALDLKNAERGTVTTVDGTRVVIKWDRTRELQSIDLGQFKTWDHGFAETVYSSQSKTYARAYVLAPVNSPLVNGQNFYTAITRARFGVKLWTEDAKQLAEKLSRRSGEKTSALEGLGRLEQYGGEGRVRDYGGKIEEARAANAQARIDGTLTRQMSRREAQSRVFGTHIAQSTRTAMEMIATLLVRAQAALDRAKIKSREDIEQRRTVERDDRSGIRER